jgi:hypothetical protein
MRSAKLAALTLAVPSLLGLGVAVATSDTALAVLTALSTLLGCAGYVIFRRQEAMAARAHKSNEALLDR